MKNDGLRSINFGKFTESYFPKLNTITPSSDGTNIDCVRDKGERLKPILSHA